ncbi:MAG: hypothetical protein H6733_12110 [Alphaproteobacteria bacterium]|nr:hypothetical protein [Alphaproteobacteria bacterium]
MSLKHLAAAAALVLSTAAAPAMAADLTGQACIANNPATPTATCFGARLELLRNGTGHLFLRLPTTTATYRLRWHRRSGHLVLDVAGTTSVLTINGSCARGQVQIAGRTLNLGVCR